eukprot:gene460-717_t
MVGGTIGKGWMMERMLPTHIVNTGIPEGDEALDACKTCIGPPAGVGRAVPILIAAADRGTECKKFTDRGGAAAASSDEQRCSATLIWCIRVDT